MSDETKLDLEAIEAKCAAATPGPLEAVVLGVAGVSATREETIAYLTRCVDVGGPDYWIVLCQKTDGPADVCHAGNGPTSRANAEFIAAARTNVPALVAEVRRLREQKDNAYNERDRCVSVVACLARALGWPVWLGTHEGDPWDDDWRNIVFVETPHGQVSWHYHDSERPMFSWIGLGMPAPKPWDGHSTPEKYNLLFGLVHDGIPATAAEAEEAERDVDRLTADLAEVYRLTGADPDGNDDAMLARKAVDAVRRLRAEADHEGEKSEEWERCYAELENLILNGEWTRSDGRTHLAIRVADGADLSCRATRQDSLRSLLAKGGSQ